MLKQSAALLLLITAAGCATSAPSTAPTATPKKPVVNMNEARRLVATDNNVRVDAEVHGDRIVVNTPISLRYQITNQRAESILVADLIPQATFDDETGIVTIDIGTEIPGQEFLPRLIAISPGEQKSFTANANLNTVFASTRTPLSVRPQALRVRVNFLSNAKPFESLVGIPEKAVRDPKLASAIFTPWVDGNETVITNAIPMRWIRSPVAEDVPPDMPSSGRRGGSPITPP